LNKVCSVFVETRFLVVPNSFLNFSMSFWQRTSPTLQMIRQRTKLFIDQKLRYDTFCISILFIFAWVKVKMTKLFIFKFLYLFNLSLSFIGFSYLDVVTDKNEHWNSND
jgi:hypothetical protein